MYSEITNSLVFKHLEKVASNLASEFQQKHKSFHTNSNLKLESVVEKFLVDSSVYNHMLEVTPHLTNEFFRKNPFVCPNIVSIQTILTQFQKRDNPAKRKATSNHSNPPFKKIKTSSEMTQNCVVYHHLLEVTPELANEFKQKHSVMFPIETSLKELVDQYFKDNGHIQQQEKKSQTSEEKITSSLQDSIQVITLSDEEVIDVSSSSESSSEEDTDSDLIPICEIRDIGSSSNNNDHSFLKELEKQFKCVVSSTSEEDTDSIIIPICEIKECGSKKVIADELSFSKATKEKNSVYKAEKDKGEVSNSVNKNRALLKPKASNKIKPVISKSQPNLIDSSKNNENLTNNPKHVMIDENMNEYRHISESSIYTDLGKTLEKDSVVDKIVLHILNKDIQISQLNFDNIVLSSGQVMRNRHASIPSNVKLGSFSPQNNNTMLSNWNKLVTEMNIDNPEETFKLFCKRPTKEAKLKANVLGLYLSQGMEKLRLAADVFVHSERKILNFSRGNISTSEHNFIMDYISQHGETPQAFNSCNKLLNRRYPSVIRQHYLKHRENLLKKGSFAILENKIIIHQVLEKFSIKTILDIKEGTVNKETFKDISTKLGRPVLNIAKHWDRFLNPLLLQYHAGTVNFDIRNILVNYLLEKNLVYMQDISWDELLKNPQFAGHTKSSLGHIFNNLVRYTQREFRCKREEVTIEQIATYVKKLNPKFGKQLSCQKQELIDYYRSLIDVKKDYF